MQLAPEDQGFGWGVRQRAGDVR